MRSDYVVLASLWGLYCAIHSALISITATTFFARALGNLYCFYRIFYNLFSLITLVALLMFSHSNRFQDPTLFIWAGNWRFLRFLLILSAIVLILAGARQYSMSQFIGWSQVRNRRSPGFSSESAEFNTGGVLRVVRHPWYLAVFILIWTSNLNPATIIINTVVSAYLVIGTLLEERKLVLEFGDKYQRYREQVPMLIPLKWLTLRLKPSSRP